MTSMMTSQSNKLDKIIRLTHVTQMTLKRLKEYARAEGVSVKLGVVLESTSDLSQKKRIVRNGRVLRESSV
jgi:hypothetical protein